MPVKLIGLWPKKIRGSRFRDRGVGHVILADDGKAPLGPGGRAAFLRVLVGNELATSL
jgi:hypothetical protein